MFGKNTTAPQRARRKEWAGRPANQPRIDRGISLGRKPRVARELAGTTITYATISAEI
jgi:hypothetical protein